MNMPAGDSSLNFNLQKREPLFIVISGLSGVGKDAVIEELLKRGIPLHKVVTATTRAPRRPSVMGWITIFCPTNASRR